MTIVFQQIDMAKTKNRTRERKPKHKDPRLMSFVKLDSWAVEHDEEYGYTRTLGPGPYIYFGDIPNMPGHCVVMR